MVFVDTVRNYPKNMPFPEAMETAIDECIQSGILEDFLRKNKAEVVKVGIFEYDEEKHLEMERNEAEERGKELGEERTLQLMTKLLEAGKIEDAKKATTDKDFRNKLYKEYGI